MNIFKIQITLFFFLSFSGFIFAQDFKPEQIQMINERVHKLADDYQTFSQLSEDGIKISPFYKKKFRSLYETENEQFSIQIFNDVNVENKDTEMSELDEYMQFISTNFPNGLAVQLTNLQISEPEKDDKNDKFYVVFQAEKKIMGLFQNKFVYNHLVKLYFKVEFIELSDNVYDNFIIRAISDKPFKIKKRRIKDHELDLFISAGKSQIFANNSLYGNEEIFNPEMGFTAGIHYNYFVNNHFGIGTGFGFSKYNSNAFLPEFYQSYDAIDSEGESYIRNVDGVNLNESYGVLYVDVPVNIYYRFKLSERFMIQLGTSACFSLKISDPYEVNGIYSYSGYYPSFNGVLADLPEYNFGSDVQTVYAGSLDLSPLGVFVSGQINLNYVLDYKSSVYIGVKYNRNLASIDGNSADNYIHSNPDQEFNSILNSGSSINLQYLGIQAGFIFKLKKK